MSQPILKEEKVDEDADDEILGEEDEQPEEDAGEDW